MIIGKLPVGLIVGCRYRWPHHGNRVCMWMPPTKGEVLALDDPRAWVGSIRFPTNPKQEDVTKHVEYCLSRNLLDECVPVLYSRKDGKFMQWDDQLLPYEEELAFWNQQRAKAFMTDNNLPETLSQIFFEGTNSRKRKEKCNPYDGDKAVAWKLGWENAI